MAYRWLSRGKLGLWLHFTRWSSQHWIGGCVLHLVDAQRQGLRGRRVDAAVAGLGVHGRAGLGAHGRGEHRDDIGESAREYGHGECWAEVSGLVGASKITPQSRGESLLMCAEKFWVECGNFF